MDAISLEYQITAALQDMTPAITNLIEKARAVESCEREIGRIDREILVARAELAGLAAQARGGEAVSAATTLPKTWKSERFEIAWWNEDSSERSSLTVDGETCGPFSIHDEIAHHEEATRARYAVSQQPSGRHIVSTWTKAAAKRFCAQAYPLLDWPAVEPGSPCPPELVGALHHIAVHARVGDRVPCPYCPDAATEQMARSGAAGLFDGEGL